MSRLPFYRSNIIVCKHKLSRSVFSITPSSDAVGRNNAAIIKQQSNKIDQFQPNISLNPPKGTRDFFPEDQRLRNWLFSKFHSTAKVFGFEEYDAPVVENEDLYIRKAGEEITQQLYNFRDKADRRLSLRPEMTPSLARMVLSKGKSLALPLKWYSIPQCWRYERMTRGRRREHFQWNMDIWGVKSIEAEAELLASIVHSFSLMGLSALDVGIKINSRKILNAIMQSLGIEEAKWAATCVLIDKLEKIPIESLSEELNTIGLGKDTVQQLLSILKISDLDELAAKLGSESSAYCLQELYHLFYLLKGYGISEWVTFDGSVVRGLAYYTGIVFEGFDRSGELRAICGGGRYDTLLESIAGSSEASIPAVGFGFGDCVIIELLKSKNLLPSDIQNASTDVLIFSTNESLKISAVSIASELRAAGISADIAFENKKLKWVFQRAEKIGAKFVLILGKEEFANGEVILKDVVKREQTLVSISDCQKTLKQLLVETDDLKSTNFL